jgi:hypothetical protein
MVGAAIAWALGLLSPTLATIGVFGVCAYIVEERRREIGIRMALGARGAQVIRLLLAQTLTATGAGLVTGFALSLAAGKLLRSYLYGVSAADPIAYAGIALLLCTAAAVTTCVPARHTNRSGDHAALRIGAGTQVAWSRIPRCADDHAQITVPLIQTRDQTHVFAQRYDTPTRDLFATERAVARAVAGPAGPERGPRFR